MLLDIHGPTRATEENLSTKSLGKIKKLFILIRNSSEENLPPKKIVFKEEMLERQSLRFVLPSPISPGSLNF